MIKIIAVFIVVALIVYGLIEGLRASTAKQRVRAVKYALYTLAVSAISAFILTLAVIFF